MAKRANSDSKPHAPRWNGPLRELKRSRGGERKEPHERLLLVPIAFPTCAFPSHDSTSHFRAHHDRKRIRCRAVSSRVLLRQTTGARQALSSMHASFLTSPHLLRGSCFGRNSLYRVRLSGENPIAGLRTMLMHQSPFGRKRGMKLWCSGDFSGVVNDWRRRGAANNGSARVVSLRMPRSLVSMVDSFHHAE